MSSRKRSRSRESEVRHASHSHSSHSHTHSSHSHTSTSYSHAQMLDEFGRDVALREKDREREKRRDRDRKSSKGSRSEKERRRSRSKEKRENGDKKRSRTRSRSQDRKRRRTEGTIDIKEHREGRDTRETSRDMKEAKEPKESGEIRYEKQGNNAKGSGITSSLPQETEELKKDDEYDPSAPSDFGADYDPEDMLSEMAMMKMFGLPVLFDTSKGKLVEGNNQGAVKLKSQRLYRQYMNRKGGFNRKLDPDKNVGRDTKKKKTVTKPGAPVKPTKGGASKGGTTNASGKAKQQV